MADLLVYSYLSAEIALDNELRVLKPYVCDTCDRNSAECVFVLLYVSERER